ncbi:MAG: chemotaxis protein CheW [Chloroherpetonaceae bacterium]|nr:chemotaxis protein CheW [Chloroherpetonaceae bacterium]
MSELQASKGPGGEIRLEDLSTIDSDAAKWLSELEADKARYQEGEEEKEQYIAVLMGDREVAFRVIDIEGILEVPRITSVPGVPDYILGICNVRGEITSVVNMYKILGLSPRRQKTRRERAAEKMIIVRGELYSVGFIVHSVLDVLRVSERDLVKINAADGELTHIAPFSRGLFTRPGEEGRSNDVILIDTEKLLRTKELMQFQ